MTEFIVEHDFVFLVEQNRDAQLRSLIVNECGIDPVRLVPILHYDGTPITARFIAGAIGEHLDALKVDPAAGGADADEGVAGRAARLLPTHQNCHFGAAARANPRIQGPRTAATGSQVRASARPE